MHFETRPGYSFLRARWEQPIDTLVVLAALATLPIVVAQARGDTAFWVVASDWLIWAIFVLDYLFMVLVVRERLAYTLRNFLKIMIIILSFPLMPHMLALVRVARLVRIVRYSES